MRSRLLPLILILPSLAFADSLWTAAGSREQGIAADLKAAQVGDIITIVIAENAVQTASQSKSSNSASNMDASVSQFLFPKSVSSFGTLKGSLPAIKFGGTSDFKGGGDVNNSQSITARAAVLITDVLPNGNLVIAGARRISFSGETQNIVLHGIVRPADVTSDNTILSSNIAEARLEFISEGTLTDAQKRGWLSKIYEKLRPL
ncbi:MAG: flagellar basal body L-ring protein FlgH [Opitutaceae bacterium]|jgi:flagellar L-ring protein precursor FlgH